jgi:hypothetical protein
MKSDDNDYTTVEYWNKRFVEEKSYEWIADFRKFSSLLLPELKKSDK